MSCRLCSRHVTSHELCIIVRKYNCHGVAPSNRSATFCKIRQKHYSYIHQGKFTISTLFIGNTGKINNDFWHKSVFIGMCTGKKLRLSDS